MATSPIGLTGTAQFGNLSKALKAAGGDLRKNYLRALRTATAPAKTAIPESARLTLPRRGGANEYFANALIIKTRTSLSGSSANVRIVATDPPFHDLRALERGILRHPVYGNREVWRNTEVHPYFFYNACMGLRPGVRKQIVAATNEVLRKITT